MWQDDLKAAIRSIPHEAWKDGAAQVTVRLPDRLDFAHGVAMRGAVNDAYFAGCAPEHLMLDGFTIYSDGTVLLFKVGRCSFNAMQRERKPSIEISSSEPHRLMDFRSL